MASRPPPDPKTDQVGSFPDAQAIHDRILDEPTEWPDGWVEQAQFRDRYDLPPFRPPRFSDETTARSVIESIATELDVSIDFVYDDGWMVVVDDMAAFPVDRWRDDAANTVIALDSETFDTYIREFLTVD